MERGAPPNHNVEIIFVVGDNETLISSSAALTGKLVRGFLNRAAEARSRMRISHTGNTNIYEEIVNGS